MSNQYSPFRSLRIWSQEFKHLEYLLETTALYDSGSARSQLDKEQLEKELERKRLESEGLMDQIHRLAKERAAISDQLSQSQSESEKKVSGLIEKSRTLEAALAEKQKNWNENEDNLRAEKERMMRELSEQNSELLREKEILTEKVEQPFVGVPAPEPPLISISPEGSSEDLIRKAVQLEEQSIEEPLDEGSFLSRWAHWWNQPVAHVIVLLS